MINDHTPEIAQVIPLPHVIAPEALHQASDDFIQGRVDPFGEESSVVKADTVELSSQEITTDEYTTFERVLGSAILQVASPIAGLTPIVVTGVVMNNLELFDKWWTNAVGAGSFVAGFICVAASVVASDEIPDTLR